MIDLLVEEIGDRFIVELHADWRAFLPHQTDILDQQQVVGRRDAEGTDLGVTPVTPEQ